MRQQVEDILERLDLPSDKGKGTLMQLLVCSLGQLDLKRLT